MGNEPRIKSFFSRENKNVPASKNSSLDYSASTCIEKLTDGNTIDIKHNFSLRRMFRIRNDNQRAMKYQKYSIFLFLFALVVFIVLASLLCYSPVTADGIRDNLQNRPNFLAELWKEPSELSSSPQARRTPVFSDATGTPNANFALESPLVFVLSSAETNSKSGLWEGPINNEQELPHDASKISIFSPHFFNKVTYFNDRSPKGNISVTLYLKRNSLKKNVKVRHLFICIVKACYSSTLHVPHAIILEDGKSVSLPIHHFTLGAEIEKIQKNKKSDDMFTYYYTSYLLKCFFKNSPSSSGNYLGHCVRPNWFNSSSSERNVFPVLTSPRSQRVKRWFTKKYEEKSASNDIDRTILPSEFTPSDRWENFKAIIPQWLGCVGSTLGCCFCFVFVMFNPVTIGTGVCMGACGVAVGGSCGTVAALGFQRMLDQTVICTELYRQGYMSAEAYLADANFGRKLNKYHPTAMKAYRVLATPVVRLMQQSPRFTEVVNIIARPWLQHMEFAEGLAPEDNLLGNVLFKITIPVLEFCTLCQEWWNSSFSVLWLLLLLKLFFDGKYKIKKLKRNSKILGSYNRTSSVR